MDFLIIGLVLLIAIAILFYQIKKIKKGNGCCDENNTCNCNKSRD